MKYFVEGDDDLTAPRDFPVLEVTPALDSGLPPLRVIGGDTQPGWEYRTSRPTSPLDSMRRGSLWTSVQPTP